MLRSLLKYMPVRVTLGSTNSHLQSDSQASLGFIHPPSPILNTTPSIALGSETQSKGRTRLRDQLGSDEEEEKTGDEDNFVNIDDLVLSQQSQVEEDIPSVLGGSFSTTRRWLKPKKVKGKESWVFKYGFRVKRDGEIFWKCK
jgi:hypothetical protein